MSNGWSAFTIHMPLSFTRQRSDTEAVAPAGDRPCALSGFVLGDAGPALNRLPFLRNPGKVNICFTYFRIV